MTTIAKRKPTAAGGGSTAASLATADEKDRRARNAELLQEIMEIFERYRGASLGTLLRQLIAAQDGIRPEDVTIGYIRDRREKLFYPRTRYDTDSRYGGYNSRGLKFFTQEEFDCMAKEVEAELSRLSTTE